jgi:cytochrome b
MKRILIWDIPARLVHWAFSAALTGATAIGFLLDKEQPLFQLHMLFGIIAVFMLMVRMVMGLVGSRYSRFTSFPVHPRELASYLTSAIVSKTKLYAGNNPGSALAAGLMFLLVPALFVSGIGYGGESMEELHEVLAWALLTVMVIHLMGLAWHTLRHRENIALAMVTGKKTGLPENAIGSGHAVWGMIILIVSGLWIAALFAGHNEQAATVKLPGLGVSLSLGENELGDSKQKRDRDDD